MNEFVSEFRSKLAKTDINKMARMGVVGLAIIAGNAVAAGTLVDMNARINNLEAESQASNVRLQDFEAYMLDRVMTDELKSCTVDMLLAGADEGEAVETCTDYVLSK